MVNNGICCWVREHARGSFRADWLRYDRLNAFPFLARYYSSIDNLLLCQGFGFEDQLVSAQPEAPANPGKDVGSDTHWW